jgi:nicotinamidase-related amidase
MSSQAIVVIDMQRGLVLGAYRQDELVATINGLITRARTAGVPILFVQHNHATFEPMMRGSRGWEIFGALDRQPDDQVVEKEACDAFFGTGLEQRLRGMGVQEIIVTGLQTEFCVDTTCRTALNHGFDVILAADAHSTGDSIMTAREVVAHHNALLANLVHPVSKIAVTVAAEIVLGDGG